MPFTLPALPFDPATLAPFCSAETFQYHHGKHHNTYVTKLNEAIAANPAYTELDLEAVIRKSHQEGVKAIYNNAAQHFNHSFFWDSLSTEHSQGENAPGDKLLTLIARDFGSLEKFRELFTAAATTHFGSGWIWLTQDSAGKLEILSQPNADTPLIVDKKPLLTLDVWEHAYYIDHRNARPAYIAAFWQFVNWSHAENQLS